MENKHTLIAGALAVVVIAAGAYLYTRRSVPVMPETGTSTPITTTVGGVTVQGGTVTVSEAPTANIKALDFRIPLTFDASVTADARVAFQKQFDATVAVLEKDATSFDGWVNLGILREMTADYKGAQADWSYAASLYDKSTVPTDNLGALHMDFIKNYPQAETDFKLSLSNDPHDINAYQQLVSLYTAYGYKGTSTALALLKQGLAANPGNQILLQLQSQLQ